MITNMTPEPDGKPAEAQDSAGCAPMHGSRFAARLVACMKIQNAKNEGTAECAEWVAQDREFALKTALNQVTSGIGIMVIAGVDPAALLTRWMDAVERSNPDTENAYSPDAGPHNEQS